MTTSDAFSSLVRGLPIGRVIGSGLRRAAPALLAYVCVRGLGLVLLALVASFTGRDPRLLLAGWDGGWYRGIADDGYGFTRVHEDGRLLADYAFFPLYPSLQGSVTDLTGLSLVNSGLVVSWVASLFAAWGIFAVGDYVYGHRVGVMLTMLWAALPVGIVQSMTYSESLFTALAAWSLYAVLTGRWVWAGVLASFAGLTRPVAAAVVAAVVVAAAIALVKLMATGRARTVAQLALTQWRIAAGALIAPLGLVGYLAWVGVQVDSARGYLDVTNGWGNGFDGGIAFVGWVWSLLASSDVALGLLLCAALALLAWLCVLCVRMRLPIPLLVFTAVLTFLALTTSGYFGSKPRYLLSAFPLLLPAAVALARAKSRRAAWILVVLATSSAIYGAVWLHSNGPP